MFDYITLHHDNESFLRYYIYRRVWSCTYCIKVWQIMNHNKSAPLTAWAIVCQIEEVRLTVVGVTQYRFIMAVEIFFYLNVTCFEYISSSQFSFHEEHRSKEENNDVGGGCYENQSMCILFYTWILFLPNSYPLQKAFLIFITFTVMR